MIDPGQSEAGPEQANIDQRTVESFGLQWSRLDQDSMPDEELVERFEEYFRVFPWDELPAGAEGFDLGCGTGRWATQVAPRVGRLHCVDPSSGALEVAKAKLGTQGNCEFHLAGADDLPFAPGSMDFGYTLGVLHHLPDPELGLRACVQKLKPGAPLLVYMYYALEFRPLWFRAIFRCSDLVRRVLYRSPEAVKRVASGLIAAFVYWPLSRFALLAEKLGADVAGFPLAYYRERSFYTLLTDARDRFGTPVEHRFSRDELEAMFSRAGLERISFSDLPPYWCGVGHRSS
jgi:SAM-dependent methyltransferase